MLFRLSEVKKSYGGAEILRGVSFQINPGEKVGLVGRNGAGKTTVFRLITGEEAPDSGEIVTVNGLKLGLLQQHVDFNPGETVHTAALSAFKDVYFSGQMGMVRGGEGRNREQSAGVRSIQLNHVVVSGSLSTVWRKNSA